MGEDDEIAVLLVNVTHICLGSLGFELHATS